VESLDVRTFADPSRLISQVRQAVRSVDPNLPIGGIATLAEQVSSNLAQQRLIARLTRYSESWLWVWLAWPLWSDVLHRRSAYSELGIRLALGSTRWSALWVVLRESFIVIGAGILVGAFCLWPERVS